MLTCEDLLRILVSKMPAAVFFVKMNNDPGLRGVQVSSSPLKAALQTLRPLPNTWSLFSFGGLFGRTYVVCTTEDLRWFLESRGPETPLELLDLHEHFVEGRPFKFFFDLDSKTPDLVSLKDEEVLAEIEKMTSAFPPDVRAGFPVVFRTRYDKAPKLSVHVIFPDLVLDHANAALGLAKCVQRNWQSPMKDAIDFLYRTNGSLRAPFARKHDAPELAFKLPIPSVPLSKTLFALSLLTQNCGVPTRIPILEASVAPDSDLPGPVLQSFRTLFGILPNEIREVSKEFPDDLYVPNRLPSRVLVTTSSRRCPIKNVEHDHATTFLTLHPDRIFAHCWHSDCRASPKILTIEKDRDLKEPLSIIFDFFFGFDVGLEELRARHVFLPVGNTFLVHGNLRFRADDLKYQVLHGLAFVELEYAKKRCFSRDKGKAVSVRELLKIFKMDEDTISAAGRTFSPLSVEECLRRKEPRPRVLEGGLLNAFNIPPMAEEEACEENGDFLFETMRQLFEPYEFDCLLNFLAYVVQRGRPRIALCLVGEEGVGKSVILNGIMSWFDPHAFVFGKGEHVQDDKFTSFINEASAILFEDPQKLDRSFLYELITADFKAKRAMHSEWSRATLWTTIFVSYNPMHNPLPLEPARQRRFLVLRVLPTLKGQGPVFEAFAQKGKAGGWRAFIEKYLLPRPVADFRVGEAIETASYRNERTRTTPFLTWLGDILTNHCFPVKVYHSPRDGEPRRPPAVDWRVYRGEITFPTKGVGTWWLGLRDAYREAFTLDEASVKEQSEMIEETSAKIYRPRFDRRGVGGRTHTTLVAWPEAVRNFLSEFAHPVLSEIDLDKEAGPSAPPLSQA